MSKAQETNPQTRKASGTAQQMNLPAEIEKAAGRIGPHVLHTPLFRSVYLGELNGGEVGLKLESEQYTGSFKARGALNKVLAMPKEEKAAGLVTASTGNHAQGFARALTLSGDKGLIYLPENAEPSKVEALKHYDVELAYYGNSCVETELHAKAQAEDKGMVWVSPYNDPMVIAGQGTIGKEILQDMPNVDVVMATIGGGGMMSGVAAYIKAHRPQTQIIGCLPENAPEMYLSAQKGEIVMLEDPPETLSDGSAGGCEPGAVTFDLCCELVDDYILQTEAQIAEGIRWMTDKHHKIIEGAAAVALGSFMNNAERFRSKKVAIIICGANITTTTLKRLL